MTVLVWFSSRFRWRTRPTGRVSLDVASGEIRTGFESNRCKKKKKKKEKEKKEERLVSSVGAATLLRLGGLRSHGTPIPLSSFIRARPRRCRYDCFVSRFCPSMDRCLDTPDTSSCTSLRFCATDCRPSGCCISSAGPIARVKRIKFARRTIFFSLETSSTVIRLD